MKHWRRFGALVAAAITMSALTACSPTEPYKAPAVDRPVAVGAKDHPADEVRAASASLAPCALLDHGVAAKLSVTTPPIAQVFSCELENSVLVTTSVPFDQGERFWQERVDFEGVVAYRTPVAFESCDLALPTSFDTAIVFDQHDYGASYDCTAVDAFAAAAVEKLRNDPESLQHAGGGDAIAACDVFEDAIGVAPKGMTFRARSLVGSGLDSCGLWADPDDLGIRAVKPQSSLWLDLRDPLPEFSSRGGWQQLEKTQVANREAMQKADDSSCDLFFDVRPSAEVTGKVLAAVVSAEDCGAAADLMSRLIPLFDTAKPLTGDVGRLLFSSDEPDSPAAGSCVDALNQAERRCTPFVQTGVSSSAAERLSIGIVDADVLCALAGDAVQTHLGDAFTPVTVIQDGSSDGSQIPRGAQACEFVTPSHAVVVRIAAALSPLDEVRDV